MTKKINRILLTVVMVLFVLNLVVALFLLTNTVKAQSGVTDCQTDPATKNPICPPVGKIRVQIPIPGISDACKYTDSNDVVIVNGQPKAVEKTCYWVDSLPFYVQKFYNFSIGIIAIIAVLMIMIGGLRWIFAAGNVGSVSEAKSTIYAAITGLVLALTSYVILYNINPRLVNLSLPGVTKVEKIEQQTSIWCNDFPRIYGTDSATGHTLRYVFYPSEVAFGTVGQGISGTNLTFNCGKKYSYGYEDESNIANKKELSMGSYCLGNYCQAHEEACFTDGGYSYCADPAKLCKDSYKTRCVQANDMMDQTLSLNNNKDDKLLGYSCMFRNDYSVLNPDECAWAKRIFCPAATDRVSCLTGPKNDGSSTVGCWTDDNGKRKAFEHKETGDQLTYCTDDNYANEEANLICCLSASGVYNVYDGDTAYKPDCKNITKCEIGTGSDQYGSNDAYQKDPCHVCK